MERIAVYPGSFDPVTSGHLDVIKRASRIFDKVVVGVLDNRSKNPIFSKDERVDLIKKVTTSIPNVEVKSFSGLLVDFMHDNDSNVIIKGLRAVSDFEYEFQMAQLNQKLFPEVETFFVMTSSEYLYVSSSAVKDVARWGGSLDGLVPDEIHEIVINKLRDR